MMAMKNNGLTAGGQTQPEIRPGDKWKDKFGVIIVIQQCAHNRVTYIREGYEHACICSPDRLRREFTRVAQETFTGWSNLNNPLDKTQKLRALINAHRGKA